MLIARFTLLAAVILSATPSLRSADIPVINDHSGSSPVCGGPCVEKAVDPDRDVERDARRAGEAYREGRLDEAERYYRRALLRAWSMDDPFYSGTVAYNLGAIAASRGLPDVATEWLVLAAADLRRAGCSAANVWLLQSDVALLRCRVDLARHYVARAACAGPQCDVATGDGCGGGGCRLIPSSRESCDCPSCNTIAVPKACAPKPCRSCLMRLPCIGSRIRDHYGNKECEAIHQARIHIAAGRIDLASGDPAAASRRVACACDASRRVCDFVLMADIEDLAARVAIESGRLPEAAKRIDRQIDYLRLATHYREIPKLLIDASAVYRDLDAFGPAAARLDRAARITHARGEHGEAWQLIRHASDLVQQTPCGSIRIRLAVTATEIRDAIDRTREQSQTMIDSNAESSDRPGNPHAEPTRQFSLDPASSLDRASRLNPPEPDSPAMIDASPETDSVEPLPPPDRSAPVFNAPESKAKNFPLSQWLKMTQLNVQSRSD